MKATRPICCASAVDLLADADTASLPSAVLVFGVGPVAAMPSWCPARAMHIGSDHREHWRALASIMSPARITTSMCAAYEEQSHIDYAAHLTAPSFNPGFNEVRRPAHAMLRRGPHRSL